jgi:beta-N-acetylhexosaminidase
MGLMRTGYTPLNWYEKRQIAPTEDDKIFRKQTVRGYVHDPGAAMYGGVAGHAGLFSNAVDLAQIMQMLLNGGTYNGKRFLSASTIALHQTALFHFAQRFRLRQTGIGSKQKPICGKVRI